MYLGLVRFCRRRGRRFGDFFVGVRYGIAGGVWFFGYVLRAGAGRVDYFLYFVVLYMSDSAADL